MICALKDLLAHDLTIARSGPIKQGIGMKKAAIFCKKEDKLKRIIVGELTRSRRCDLEEGGEAVE